MSPARRPARSASGPFDRIRTQDAEGRDLWSARDIQPLLDYSSWDKFRQVIAKAMEACIQSKQPVEDHFSQVGKMVPLGSGATREIDDFRLTRYACYLIVQNGDPSKPVIAQGQTYFALQTRRQELSDSAAFAQASEDGKRLAIRQELSERNRHLAAAAKDAGDDLPENLPTPPDSIRTLETRQRKELGGKA